MVGREEVFPNRFDRQQVSDVRDNPMEDAKVLLLEDVQIKGAGVAMLFIDSNLI